MNTRNTYEIAVASGASVAMVWALGGCASVKEFGDSPGDVLAGHPAKVVSKLYSVDDVIEDGPRGYVLKLRTEDCPPSIQPAPGLGSFGQSCVERDHIVDANTYLLPNGLILTWSGQEGSSRVEQHKFRTEYRHARVYHFALFVSQCIGASNNDTTSECVTDSVPVDVETWRNATVGQTIYFAGDQGKVVSQ